MSESAVEVAPGGLSLEVVLAGACFCAGMSVSAATAFLRQQPPSLMLLAGWPLFALSAAAVLDRRPGSRVGWALAALGLTPVLDIGLALARGHGSTHSAGLVGTVEDLAGVHVVLLAGVVLWATRPPARRPAGLAALVLAVLGAALVVADVNYAGWTLVVTGLGCLVTLQLLDVRSDERTERRRLTLLAVTFGAGGVVVGLGAVLARRDVAGYVACSTLVLTAALVTALSVAEELRPLLDDLLDLLVALGAVGVAGLAALLVWIGSGVVKTASPPTSAAFTAVVTFALAVPGAVWVRRSVLNRRYGSGVISPSDVAAITADLTARIDPRDLLDKAARMVAAASGSREARIVLGDDPEVPGGWVENDLLVGGDRVGALLVDAGGPEGLEPRQARVVSQLLPTVALVTRAVGLAVEAEHARYDVARERDAERGRILGDLHDGLGPALAGMSMRVQASLRSTPSPEHAALLADLADGLAASRTDLRRIVSGLTPSALDEGDLGSALESLVASFRGPHDGPSLSLTTALSGTLAKEVQVAVYRCVAEGVTNALRHASARSISVAVARNGSCVSVDVVDDGAGGTVVPGVGLSSLAARAEAGGGRLVVRRAQPRGTRLHLELPLDTA